MMRRGARLGQHFLKNAHYARMLVAEAGVTAKDTVVEIGPGKGALTREILATGARVIAIEKDGALIDTLKDTFRAEISRGVLDVLHLDVRNADLVGHGLRPQEYILAANIPYYITGEIIRTFLSTDIQPKTMALMVQKEVAQRIVSEKESILSIAVKAYGKPRVAAKVSRGNFSPPPSVDSAILVVSDISKQHFKFLSEEFFFDVVRSGFSSKRKLLVNNLGEKFGKARAAAALAESKIPEKARAEELHTNDWFALAKFLVK